ncbi:hypothetical protein [Vibrio parahaemolyticus]|uniref:hypothetical protein n=1 Tax=Vibrio parahaemolyticus TaxID=670 RepID=UPI00084B83E2|nr:hypothetical protein [Vibrio parahaemolyticus]ODZ33115.1 hypothetical protein BBN02_19465 [Vibrio parahaemolyticus]HCE5137801.1 hypothetical protein [Vibrio parahaemolyticus]
MDYEELKRQGIESFLADEELNKASRIEHFVELNELFGPQGDKLLTGGMQSQLALHELANSYVNGNYMAVVLLVQAFIEHSLSGEFIMRGQNAIAESSFKKIIDSSLSHDIIDADLYDLLEALRKIRNPYVHAKAGIKSGSLIKKMIDGRFESAELLAKSDALQSLTILKVFMEQNVVMWFPEDEA